MTEQNRAQFTRKRKTAARRGIWTILPR